MNSENLTNIELTCQALHSGQLIAFPTDTVYGLGCDPQNDTAIARIFQVKQRPLDQPLAVLIHDLTQIHDWAINVTPEILQLAEHYWPGPLTLVLDKAPHVSDVLTGGESSIGLRIPNHPLALGLLQQFGHGIATTSANAHGKPSPVTAADVTQDLGDKVDCILEGACPVGQASTVLDCRGGKFEVLREGSILLPLR